MSWHKRILGASVVLALCACGGGGNNNSASSAASPAESAAASPAASAQASAQAMASGNAMGSETGGGMMSEAAPIPADLNCGAVKPVWVNTKTHVYREAGSPLYGKTKHGKYMCPSAAKAEGDHPAGSNPPHHHGKGSDS